MTKIVHIRKEPYDVYIGRPSKFGNPFSHKEGTLAKFKVKSRSEAISKYREWILSNPSKLEELEELRGKTLGCWCKGADGKGACHGDVIVELLEQKDYSNKT